MALPEWADELQGRVPRLFLLSFLGLASPLGLSVEWDGDVDFKRKDRGLDRRKEKFLARAMM